MLLYVGIDKTHENKDVVCWKLEPCVCVLGVSMMNKFYLMLFDYCICCGEYEMNEIYGNMSVEVLAENGLPCMSK